MKRVLLVGAELAELFSSGGEGEYNLALLSCLQSAGYDVKCILPAYKGILEDTRFVHTTEVQELVVWPDGPHTHSCRIERIEVPNLNDNSLTIPVILVGTHPHFERADKPKYIYKEQGESPEPWEEFSRAVIDYLLFTENEWMPEIVHVQDAHCALIPVFISRLRLQGCRFANHCRTVQTIHNLTYQGVGSRERIYHAGLPDDLYATLFECNGNMNTLKAGLLTADVVSTVSITYADEICSGPDFGFQLEGVLRLLRSQGRLRGIVNGISERRWQIPGLSYHSDRSREARLADRRQVLAARLTAKEEVFSSVAASVRAKRSKPGASKSTVSSPTGWDTPEAKVPTLSLRSRWDEQKGLYAFVDGLERLLDQGIKVLVVTWLTPESPKPNQVLTEAEARSWNYWQRLNEIAIQREDCLVVNPPCLEGQPNVELHYAASDFFLVPSRFEPCGLTQLECARYGTVPIVRRTGGLADSVAECQTNAYPSPNGFTFDNSHWGDLVWAVERAVSRYLKFHAGEDDYLGWMIDNALLQNNSWDSRLPQYELLYGISDPHIALTA